jgi:predicted HTH domain antitoxin
VPVIISDETLVQTGMTEREAIIEIACRLFDAGKLHLWLAAKLAGLSRLEFEKQLSDRQIAINRPTVEDLAEEMAELDRLGY